MRNILKYFFKGWSENKVPKGDSITVIEPKSGFQVLNLIELKEYKDLLFFLVWKDIKVLYAQTILGFSWAIIQPLIQIIIFTIVFGKVAKVSTDGIPYVLFSSVAIIPWTYLSQTMSKSSQSLVTGQHMLGKVYFPRLIFPITSIFSKLIDFLISMLLILAITIYYRILPTYNLFFFPFFVLFMMAISTGIGLWFSAMAIRFRDVNHAMPFAIRMLMYTAPVVYSASSISDKYRLLYSFNPIVGVIEGFRACFLGTPFPWMYIWPGLISAMVLLISGAFYFKHMEKIFVDVI
jgi:lipopolysaccharide transport system permease protein